MTAASSWRSGSASTVSRRTGSSTAGDGQTATCGHGDGRLRVGFSAGSSGPRMTAASCEGVDQGIFLTFLGTRGIRDWRL